MAINFEAANMEGYNNPKIEVFKAIIDFTTNAIIEAPSKTELIRCLRRGSIPALAVFTPDGSEWNLLWVYTGVSDNEGDDIMFGNIALTIGYSANSDSPIVAAG